MMDKDDTTGESLILIDFDLAAYGYRYFPRQRIPAYASPLDRLVSNDNFRGYDAAFVLKQISSQAIKDGLTDEFMSDEDINEWLRIYKDNLNEETASLEELLFEVNLMLPSVALSKIFSISWNQQGIHDQSSPWTDRSELVADFKKCFGPGPVKVRESLVSSIMI